MCDYMSPLWLLVFSTDFIPRQIQDLWLTHRVWNSLNNTEFASSVAVIMFIQSVDQQRYIV